MMNHKITLLFIPHRVIPHNFSSVQYVFGTTMKNIFNVTYFLG